MATTGDGDGGADRLRELAESGEGFVAVGQDGDDHVVIAVGAPAERAGAIASATGVRVGRIEDGEIERLVLAFFAERDAEDDQEPAFVLALAPAVPEQRAHLATLARAVRASLVVLEVPGGRAPRRAGDRRGRAGRAARAVARGGDRGGLARAPAGPQAVGAGASSATRIRQRPVPSQASHSPASPRMCIRQCSTRAPTTCAISGCRPNGAATR